MTFSTRFAPSPTGPLHIGHAYSALIAYRLAVENNGVFHLRIEDIDQSRARTVWTQQIFEDLEWLGIKWAQPVLTQSERLTTYQDALKTLWYQGLLYRCSCNRRDITDALNAPQGRIPYGPDGIIYPGTCRDKPIDPQSDMPNGVLRLNLRRALSRLSDPIVFQEFGSGPNGETGQQQMPHAFAIKCLGDVVLARKDMGTSYHLSVVIDDAFQAITTVTRGQDLFEATFIHVVLQKLLGVPSPNYMHHRLITDANGKRLAKRDDAKAIRTYKEDGASPDDIEKLVGLA